MKIGKWSIGIRNYAKTWYKYMIPKEVMGKRHEYFGHGIWWLGFYFYKPKKCPICGNYMCSMGGLREYNENDKFVKVVCRQCYQDSKYAKDYEKRTYKCKLACTECKYAIH